jgi:hypothetical protein
LESEVDDIDLLRELVLQRLTFSFKGQLESVAVPPLALGSSAEPIEPSRADEAPAQETPPPDSPKKRGRQKKTQAAPPAPPSPTPRATGNDVDTDKSTVDRKAQNEALDLPEDCSIPESLRRAS